MRARKLIPLLLLAVAACSTPARSRTAVYGGDLEEPVRVTTGSLFVSTPAPPELLPVQVQQPRLWVRKASGDLGALLTSVRGIKGVSGAALVRVGRAKVAGNKRTAQVLLGAIEPESFRPMSPQATADALDVWRRLLDGEATFAPNVAQKLGLSPGQPVVAAGATLKVGAIAPTVSPALAEALVTRAAADKAGLGGEETILVALEKKVNADTVAKRLRAQNLAVEVLKPDASRSRGRASIEAMRYIERDAGMIEIESGWVSRNISTGRVPVLRGVVRCHRVMVPQLRGALQEVLDRGLAPLIDPSQYGGCYVPRHIDFDPAKPISMHAWGLAVDLNVKTNPLGAPPTMDLRIVEVFQRWGFVWGGNWTRPDGMHFQLAALVHNVDG